MEGSCSYEYRPQDKIRKKIHNLMDDTMRLKALEAEDHLRLDNIIGFIKENHPDKLSKLMVQIEKYRLEIQHYYMKELKVYEEELIYLDIMLTHLDTFMSSIRKDIPESEQKDKYPKVSSFKFTLTLKDIRMPKKWFVARHFDMPLEKNVTLFTFSDTDLESFVMNILAIPEEFFWKDIIFSSEMDTLEKRKALLRLHIARFGYDDRHPSYSMYYEILGIDYKTEYEIREKLNNRYMCDARILITGAIQNLTEIVRREYGDLPGIIMKAQSDVTWLSCIKDRIILDANIPMQLHLLELSIDE